MPPPGTRLQIAAIVSACTTSLSRLPSLLRRSKFYGLSALFSECTAPRGDIVSHYYGAFKCKADIACACVRIDRHGRRNGRILFFFLFFTSSSNLIKLEMKTPPRSTRDANGGNTWKLNQSINFSVTVRRYPAATELDYILNDTIKGSICSDLFCGATPRLVVMLRPR